MEYIDVIHPYHPYMVGMTGIVLVREIGILCAAIVVVAIQRPENFEMALARRLDARLDDILMSGCRVAVEGPHL